VEVLQEIFAEVLNIPETQITDQLSPKTFKAWNSMAHMKLVMAMEESFNIMFTVDDVRSIKSFADARDILVEKGVDT
jgi:acyl carrier protein